MWVTILDFRINLWHTSQKNLFPSWSNLKKKNYHRGGKITKYEIDCFSSMLHIVRNMYLYNQSLFFLYKADCDHVIVDFILTVSPWV